jgi:hypothetical protein
MSHWIKLYTEILQDPKMGRLTDSQYRTCINVFLLAGSEEHGGALGPTADVAWKLRMDEATCGNDLAALADLEIVHLAEDGWQVTHFQERQARKPSDEPEKVRERVAKYRAGNADVTPAKHPVTPIEKNRLEEKRADPLSSGPSTEDDPIVERLMEHGITYTVAITLASGRDALATAWMDHVDKNPGIPNVGAYLTKNIRAGRNPPTSGHGPPGKPPPAPDPSVAETIARFTNQPGVLERIG